VSTSEELSGLSDDKLASAQAGWTKDNPKYILAENDWRRRLAEYQYDLNKAIVLEQHKLNKTIAKSHKRTVIIVAIVTALSGVFGGLIQKYGPDLPWTHKSHTHTQIQSGRDISTRAKGPQKEPRGSGKNIEDTKKVSSQPPVIFKDSLTSPWRGR